MVNFFQIKKGESTVEECKLASQVKGKILPVRHQAQSKTKSKVVTEEDKKHSCFIALRKARADARLVGIRAKRAKDAAENPDDVTKKPKK